MYRCERQEEGYQQGFVGQRVEKDTQFSHNAEAASGESVEPVSDAGQQNYDERSLILPRPKQPPQKGCSEQASESKSIR